MTYPHTVLAPGVSWPTRAPTNRAGGRGWKRPQLSYDQVLEIRKLRRKGVPYKELSERYKIARTTLANAINALGPYANF